MSAATSVAQADWTQVMLAVLNVVQTLALAVMADRSRRVRRTLAPSGDRRSLPRQRPERP